MVALSTDLASFHIDPETLEFDLPQNLIAQEPLSQRDAARLMVVDRRTGKIAHRLFSDLTYYLRAGDALVLNRARVDRAKLVGRKSTGGRVEIIFVGETSEPRVWRALVRPYIKEGTVFTIGNSARMRLVGRVASGECLVLSEDRDPRELMEAEGRLPLPPYIKREEKDPRAHQDESDYQTVYASAPGSVAAPTAGLHFSKELLAQLEKKGIERIEVTLHVGWGTFKPIVSTVSRHEMLAERYEIPPASFEALKKVVTEGRRLISVGTTSTRVIESLDLQTPQPVRGGDTNIFITPGYHFKYIAGLVTNFHVPRSTPIALTAAFLGLSQLERAYAEAIREQYRFYSYGDAMLVL